MTYEKLKGDPVMQKASIALIMGACVAVGVSGSAFAASKLQVQARVDNFTDRTLTSYSAGVDGGKFLSPPSSIEGKGAGRWQAEGKHAFGVAVHYKLEGSRYNVVVDAEIHRGKPNLATCVITDDAGAVDNSKYICGAFVDDRKNAELIIRVFEV
ncbi:hypothetical protein ACN6AT_36905 (plasmid) [Streptomyces sp. JL4002]|uniref:hypothetical protein n=1 Tax=Streptomyces sp. JL4002 TaxID=3404781 RepID=UPI003B27FE52